jgi:hypothetical protein
METKSVKLIVLVLIASFHIFSGCSVARLAVGKDGKDVSRIQVGTSREETESALGKQVKEWRSDTGVLYCTYEYDLGCKPAPGYAFVSLFMDVATLGIWEGFLSSKLDEVCDHDFNRVLISYDAQDRIIGLFREFDSLPPDGRSTKYRSLRELEPAAQNKSNTK